MKWLIGSKKRLVIIGFVAAVILAGGSSANADSEPIEITVLYDNYTLTEGCNADWGFSCLITGTEKNILFDAGAYGNILLGNMDKLGVGAQDADLVVISHNHGDHTGDWQTIGGVFSFLGRNSDVTVYLPPSVPSGPIRNVEATGASTQIVNEPIRLCECVHLTGPMGTSTIEQSVVLDTPKGLVVITGCAHPGVVQIIQKAKQMLDKDVYFVFGGFHLLNDSDSQIMSKIQQFKSLGVRKCGASHCTGDRAIELFKQEYGADFVPIGVGPITIPVVYDLNGDGIVDAADMCIIVDHWKTDEPSCDLVPGPFGDGIVDVQDLIAMSEHLFEEILPAELVAYWKLDEVEGDIAYNSIGDNHGILSGNPTWQPDSGQVAGTLEFDGIYDYISTDFVLNPGDGPFSTFAWIKGGAPGQVIIAQTDGIGTGETWLGIAASDGSLMTGLMPPQVGRTVIFPLESQSFITDGQWHYIGFVWDGSYRSLYVDGTEVARDANPITLAPLKSATGGLYIGTGKDLDTGTFFSGMIDDVRIYNKALNTKEISSLVQ
jgi:7,8-dihydropterin-6-yl-methyl-4-(beta-D-ribofuranosyl)aminobenzene 5'-phosphate synthase